jgi:hypothetical protein
MYLLSFGQRVTTGKRILLAGLLCSLVLVVAVTYRGASGNEFHFDDYDNIVRYGPVRMDQFELQALADAFMHPMIEHRNVPSLTFAIDWWRGGGEARAFLQTNVFLHVLTTLSLFGLLVQLLRRWAAAQSQAVMLTAFAAAAIWAVHPINSQAVNLIVQRMAILATLFVLLSLSCYLIARTRSRPWRIPWFVAAVAFGLLGAFSKENAWILPLLLLGVEYGVIRHGQALIRGPQDWLLLSLPFLIEHGRTFADAAARNLLLPVAGSVAIAGAFFPGTRLPGLDVLAGAADDLGLHSRAGTPAAPGIVVIRAADVENHRDAVALAVCDAGDRKLFCTTRAGFRAPDVPADGGSRGSPGYRDRVTRQSVPETETYPRRNGRPGYDRIVALDIRPHE